MARDEEGIGASAPGRAPLRGLRVRRAEPRDREFLVRANRALASESEGRELSAELVRLGVDAALGDPAKGAYHIAEASGEPVGCLLVTLEWSDWRNGWFWWIQSVYVVPEARRRGVYSELHRSVLAAAREAGDVCGVRLYVDEDNVTAQQTYLKLGMQPARYRMFEVDFVLGAGDSPA